MVQNIRSRVQNFKAWHTKATPNGKCCEGYIVPSMSCQFTDVKTVLKWRETMLKSSKVVLFPSPYKVGQAGNFWTLLCIHVHTRKSHWNPNSHHAVKLFGCSMTVPWTVLSPSSILPLSSSYYSFTPTTKNLVPVSNMLLFHFLILQNCQIVKSLKSGSVYTHLKPRGHRVTQLIC